MAVHAVNYLPDGSPPTPEKAVPGTENPAGLLIYARLRVPVRGTGAVMDFVSDASWIVTDKATDGWEKTEFRPAGWRAANELGGASMAPWRLSGNLIPAQFAAQFAATNKGEVRAALVAADPLMTALGRPNREQVVTTRPTTATTLQALELTNGKTLAETLRRGAADMVKQNGKGRKLIVDIYEQAVGRKPTRAELKLAGELVGPKPQPAAVEDFLWAMVMLPEFQLIY